MRAKEKGGMDERGKKGEEWKEVLSTPQNPEYKPASFYCNYLRCNYCCNALNDLL
jgi:hypothetical protein